MWLKVIEFSIVLLLTLQNEASAYKVIELTGLEPQTTIEIIGESELYTQEFATFYFELQEAGEDGGQGDIHLHISVRYDDNKLVLNNWINGEWGQEEVHYIDSQDTTTVKITPRNNSFLININGKKFIFKYKMPKENLGKIKYLVIGGKFDTSFIDVEAAPCNCN